MRLSPTEREVINKELFQKVQDLVGSAALSALIDPNNYCKRNARINLSKMARSLNVKPHQINKIVTQIRKMCEADEDE